MNSHSLKIKDKSKTAVKIQLGYNVDSLNSDGKTVNSERDVFRLFAVNPRCNPDNGYFTSVAIFTPYIGFSKQKPKETE